MVRIAAAMAKSRRHAPGDTAEHDELITGSWRPLVYRNPDLPDGQIDKAAFVLCLASALEGAYVRVLDGLGGNTAVQCVSGRLQLKKLRPLAEPPLMKELRSLIDGMLPQLDFPELLLEVFDRTRLPAGLHPHLRRRCCARLSPIQYEHINFPGRYAFTHADVGSGLRPFHDLPASAG